MPKFDLFDNDNDYFDDEGSSNEEESRSERDDEKQSLDADGIGQWPMVMMDDGFVTD